MLRDTKKKKKNKNQNQKKKKKFYNKKIEKRECMKETKTTILTVTTQKYR